MIPRPYCLSPAERAERERLERYSHVLELLMRLSGVIALSELPDGGEMLRAAARVLAR